MCFSEVSRATWLSWKQYFRVYFLWFQLVLIFNAFQILPLVYLKIEVFLNTLCGHMSKGQTSKAKRLSSLLIINGILFLVFGVHR